VHFDPRKSLAARADLHRKRAASSLALHGGRDLGSIRLRPSHQDVVDHEPRVRARGFVTRRRRGSCHEYTSGNEGTLYYFNAEGLLENFASEDRSRSSTDGKAFTQLRFSTPVGDYRTYGPYRLASKGEARWHAPDGEFAYGEFRLVDIDYNVRP